jgi:tetratricopeptide (TPR) repeat protein
MKQYYYAKNDVKYGPFSIEDLKSHSITKSTLVWCEGMPDWKNADHIEELKEILHIEPPPIPKISKISTLSSHEVELYHDKYFPRPKNKDVFIGLGITWIILFAIISLVESDAILGRVEDTQDLRFTLLIAKFIIALIVTKSANNIGRIGILWFIFSLFFTGLAMIIHGSIKKKVIPKNFGTYSNTEKSKYLSGYAFLISKLGFNNDALFYVQKAIDYNPNNFFAYDVRGYIKYYLNDYESALIDVDYSIEKEDNSAGKYHHRAHIKFKLNDSEGACKDWKKASKMGDQNAKIAYKKHCMAH